MVHESLVLRFLILGLLSLIFFKGEEGRMKRGEVVVAVEMKVIWLIYFSYFSYTLWTKIRGWGEWLGLGDACTCAFLRSFPIFYFSIVVEIRGE